MVARPLTRTSIVVSGEQIVQQQRMDLSVRVFEHLPRPWGRFSVGDVALLGASSTPCTQSLPFHEIDSHFMPHQLHTEADVEAVLSAPGPTWLFKHSNACGVSQMAYDQVVQFLSAHPDQQLSMVVIQEHRPLSNLISNRLKYVHQSPQLFLLAHGEVKWSATHWSIKADAMTAALTAAT